MTSAANELDALFLSPHPDDVELFCGGTVAKLLARGHRVSIADLTAGELSTNGDPATRTAEAEEAARRLGLSEGRMQLGLPDGGIDDRDPAQLRSVVELLRSSRCRLLVAPWSVDRHPDHEAAGRLARRAWFFAGLRRFESARAPHRPHSLWYYPAHRPADPQVLVDVSEQMERWREAVAAYRTQLGGGPEQFRTYVNRPSFLEELEGRRRQHGALCGASFAEGFRVELPVAVDDPLMVVPQSYGPC